MKRGDQEVIDTGLNVLGKIELMLRDSKPRYFLDNLTYSMIDIYAFPFISRLYYLKGSLLNDLYNELKLEERFPHITAWVTEMRNKKDLNNPEVMTQVEPF